MTLPGIHSSSIDVTNDGVAKAGEKHLRVQVGNGTVALLIQHPTSLQEAQGISLASKLPK